ncbi:MAG: hypothetical protein L3J05_08980 [Robiginitomaculum sp.]|nr:hypothetical protein [Robiginitomaculum sp.]
MNKLFRKLCPENKNIEDILLKVSALNDFYSTNIFDTTSVAKHVLNCQIDGDLKSGNIGLVDRVAPVTIKGKTRKFYSFATKYCSHHKPETYPIYDSYVEKMLMHFKKRDNFFDFKKVELKRYEIFLRVIQAFRSYYILDDCSLRQIDIYLWIAGKEHFPNKY